jgi:tRNA(fMet)-specific endonuclease VapC
MIAFDTDVFSEILLGNKVFANRASKIPVDEQAVPIVAIEELLRGRLDVIRKAESGRSRVSIDRAYELFASTISDLRRIRFLGYNSEAESLFQRWRKKKVRASTHDLRIAAICVIHSATLVSRNRKDFEIIPGLHVEFWG